MFWSNLGESTVDSNKFIAMGVLSWNTVFYFRVKVFPRIIHWDDMSFIKCTVYSFSQNRINVICSLNITTDDVYQTIFFLTYWPTVPIGQYSGLQRGKQTKFTST